MGGGAMSWLPHSPSQNIGEGQCSEGWTTDFSTTESGAEEQLKGFV